MKWYYSGAKSLDVEQRSPEKSLGGFRSSTVVPNGRINSMFNDFSSLSVNEGKSETKAFFIKNDFNTKVTGILIYATYPENPEIQFEIASVKGDEMELLKSSSDEPYYEEFYDCRVVLSYVDLKINETFIIGEVVKIEGVEIPVPDGRRETFMNNAVKAFDSSFKYKAYIIDGSTLRIEYRLLGIYINTPVVETFNQNTIITKPFAYGFDNSRLIADELLPGESLGIYLKRNIKIKESKTFEDYKEMYEVFRDSGYKQTQNLTTETVNFCLEFTK